MAESQPELTHPVTGVPLPKLRELTVRELETGISYWPVGVPEMVSSNLKGYSDDPAVQKAHRLWTYVQGAEIGATAFTRGNYFLLDGVNAAPVQFYKER